MEKMLKTLNPSLSQHNISDQTKVDVAHYILTMR